jgi:hypothetical protein
MPETETGIVLSFLWWITSVETRSRSIEDGFSVLLFNALSQLVWKRLSWSRIDFELVRLRCCGELSLTSNGTAERLSRYPCSIEA